METTQPQANEKAETAIFCVERSDRTPTTTEWLEIEIPVDAIWSGSVLARLVAAQKQAEASRGCGVGIETVDIGDKKGIVLRGVPEAAMRDVGAYLAGGRVPLDSDAVAKLAGLLDYFGLLTVRCEYPTGFLRIKLRETWFRKNLYCPAFARHKIQEPLYDLQRVECLATALMGAVRLRAEKQRIITPPDGDVFTSVLICSEPGLSRQFLLEVPFKTAAWRSLIDAPLTAERAKEFGHAPLWRCSWQQAGRTLADPHEGLLSHYETKGASRPGISPPLGQAELLWSPKLCLDTAALWSNVLLAGGAVAHSLLGLPPTARGHDFDLFLWGMSHEQGLAKITELICALRPRQIYRTKRALTLVCCNDSRKYQIVLRLYRTPSEILHSFDVDACCVGFDGSCVLMTERAQHAFDMMTNVVDFDLLSPSYESRLVKYMDRHFAVAIPQFDPAYLNCASLLSINEECSEARRLIGQHMRGLDVILYAVFSGYCTKRSDYNGSETRGAENAERLHAAKYFTIAAPKLLRPERIGESERWGLPELDADDERKVWIFVPPNAEGYSVTLGDCSSQWSPEIVEKTVCCTPKPEKCGLLLPPRIELLQLKAGEQATSTYHASVLANIETWYNGCFFSTEGNKGASEALSSVLSEVRNALASKGEKRRQNTRKQPSNAWPYGWLHPVHVSNREAEYEMRRVGGWYNGEDRTHRVVVERQRTGSDNENFDQQLAWSLALEDDEEDGILSRLSGINLVENPQQPREMDKLTEESFETESAKDEM